MSWRILILILIAIALFLGVLWTLTLGPKAHAQLHGVSAVPQSLLAVVPTPTQPAQGRLSQSPTYQVTKAGNYKGTSDPRWNWWREMRKHDSKFEWKMPINFYGKVIDRAGQPVQGARIRFQWTDMSPTGTTEKFSETDADGMFALTNETGKNLGVYVSKDGYHVSEGGRRSFEYAAFFEPNYIEPDPQKPVLFQIVKKLEKEPLIVRAARKKLSYDHGEYYYDLERGTLGERPPTGPGLKFTIARKQAPQGAPFDWMWTVHGINTVLQTATDEFPQLAPTENYISSWKIDEKAKGEGFLRLATARFYLRTSDGRYGRVDLALSHPNAREVGPSLSVKSYLNPSGSRNVDYDPSEDEDSP